MGGKKLLGLLVIGAALIATPAAAMAGKGGGNKPAPVVSSIRLNGGDDTARLVGTLAFGSAVTFTTTIEPLSGKEWPMVYVECRSVNDGSVLYGQLDYPDTTFVLGGGSSPWWSVQSDADCTAQLLAYSKSAGAGRLLAASESFYASGWVAA
jgi:hypothetical protein